MFHSIAQKCSINEQNGMASGRSVIIISGGYFSILVAEPYQFQNFRFVLNFNLNQTINKDLVVYLL